MPRLPDLNDLGARPIPVSNRAIATVRNAGAVGEAVAGIGNAVSDIGRSVQRAQITQAETASKELDNQFTSEARDLLYTGENAYYSTKGKMAVDGRKPTEERLRQMAQSYIERAPSGFGKRMVEDVLNKRINAELTDIAQYSQRQGDLWADQQSVGRISEATQNAVLFRNDPTKLAAQRGIIEGEVLDQAKRNGWDEEYTAGELRRERGKVDTVIAKTLMVDDVATAKDYLDTHPDIDVSDRIQLDAAMKPLLEARWADQKLDEVMGVSGNGTPLNSAPEGLIAPGNIDLANRPVVRNKDGSISTVRSITVGVDGKYVLIPTVSDDGRIMTDQEAVKVAKLSGKHLGIFETEAEADAYAKDLHEAQAAKYAPPPPGETGPVISWQRMYKYGILPNEGGVGKNGKFLVSSAGAVGPGQVIPDTARQVWKAAFPGLPFNEQMYRTDYNTNFVLGGTYFKQLLDTFGDPLMAAAAYNAGPGSDNPRSKAYNRGLKVALRRAKAAGTPNDWVQYLPAKETRDYVSNFAKRLNIAATQDTPGVPEHHDIEDIYSRIDKVAARQGWTYEQTEAVKQQADRRVAREEHAITQRQNNAYDQVTQTMAMLGDSFKDVRQAGPAYLDLSGTQKLTVQNVAAVNAKPQPVETDLHTWWALKEIQAEKPELFKSLDPFQYADRLSQGDLKQLINDQTSMTVGSPEQVNDSRIFSVSRDAMTMAGFQFGDDKKGRADAPRRQHFLEGMNRFAKAWSAENPGKSPTDEQLRKWAATWLTTYDGKMLFEMRMSEVGKTIPPTDRALIEQALRQGGHPVTEENIAQIYLRRLRLGQ